MLPILRTISVGSVLLALTLLMLALKPPEDSRAHFVRLDAPARGALIDRRAHPEWRQLLMLAAFRRAEALQALRALPDGPPRRPPAKPAPDRTVAALPDGQGGGDAPDVTGAIPDASDAATMPIGIGEASSTELPVMPRKELPPVIAPPQLAPRESGEPQPATQQPAPRRGAAATPN